MKFITRLAVIRVKELSLKEKGAIFCNYPNEMQSDFDIRRIYPRKKVPQNLQSTSTFLNMNLMVNPTLTMSISNEIFVQTIVVIFCRVSSVRGTRNTGHAQAGEAMRGRQAKEAKREAGASAIRDARKWLAKR